MCCRTMLLKARLGEVQKYVRITEPDLKEFLIAGKKWTLGPCNFNYFI